MKQIIISEELYDQLVKYFDNKADADYDYYGERFTPNKEMLLSYWLKVHTSVYSDQPTLGCGELKNYNSGI